MTFRSLTESKVYCFYNKIVLLDVIIYFCALKRVVIASFHILYNLSSCIVIIL